MKNLVKYILKRITIHPKDVDIEEENLNNNVTLKIKCHQEDIPRIIGKEGKVIRAIRSITKVAARKQSLWINLQIEEN